MNAPIKRQHDWILGVFDDLMAYAKKNELHILGSEIKMMKENSMVEIQAKSDHTTFSRIRVEPQVPTPVGMQGLEGSIEWYVSPSRPCRVMPPFGQLHDS